MLILATIMIFLVSDSCWEVPKLTKNIVITIDKKGNAVIDESIVLDRQANMIICSMGISTPDRFITRVHFDINGRNISSDEIIFKNIDMNGVKIGYYQLKNPVQFYVNDEDKIITTRWIYQYSIFTKYQALICDSFESYKFNLYEVFAPVFQKLQINESIIVDALDSAFHIECRNFPEYKKQIKSTHSVSLSRQFESSNSTKIGVVKNRYFVFRKYNQPSMGEFQRQIDFTKIDRMEEQWSFKIKTDSILKGCHIQIPFPGIIDISNPDILVNIDGNLHKPFPIDSIKLSRLQEGEKSDSNTFYYYSGYSIDEFDPNLKRKNIDILFPYVPHQIATTIVKVKYNPLITGLVKKIDCFNYQIKYYLWFLPDSMREDLLRINIPEDMEISDIINYNSHIVDSSSTSMAFINMNNESYIESPLIINIKMQGSIIANWLRLINLTISLITILCIVLYSIKRECRLLLENFLKKLIFPFLIVLIPIEIGLLFGKSNTLEVAAYTFLWGPVIIILLSIPYLLKGSK